jgi:hypothetical protein
MTVKADGESDFVNVEIAPREQCNRRRQTLQLTIVHFNPMHFAGRNGALFNSCNSIATALQSSRFESLRKTIVK